MSNFDKDPLVTIPYVEHEAEMYRAERVVKRWITASGVLCGIVVALIVALVLTNI